jgi:hypothetical protein
LTAVLGNLAKQDYDKWDLEVDLFRLFDDREVRLQRCTIERFIEDELPPGGNGLYQALSKLQPAEYEAWAIVDPYIYVDNDYRDEASPEDFTQLAGYEDMDGNFVPCPSLSPLPSYCRSSDDARAFKQRAFGPYLYLSSREVPEEWEMDHEASLVTAVGATIATYRAHTNAVAIVGTVLNAMASGWTHELAYFRIEENA